MISKLNIKNKSLFGDDMTEVRILIAFRFISLTITSIFCLLNHVDHTVSTKTIIICCLFISSIILSYLYSAFRGSPRIIIILLIVETIGNLILMIPSGGVKSPFIWYTLNTILISSIFLKRIYYWVNFIIYILVYLLFSRLLNNQNLNMLHIVKSESHLLLSFTMIIIAIQAWATVIKMTKEDSKRLKEINVQLEIANDLIIKSMNHSKELYRSVSILTNQGNREGILNISFEHIKRITGANTVFFYDMQKDLNKITCFDYNHIVETIEKFIGNELESILEANAPLEVNIQNSRVLVIPIGSACKIYGVLGLEVTNNRDNIIYRNNMEQLQFLSELISTAFERLEMEEKSHRLIVKEEQNRIANEIHDSVLQRLFSMSWGMFSLIREMDNKTQSEIIEELNLFRNNTDKVIRGLREKIYGFSWKKSGVNSFNLEVKRYIEDIKRLNKVNIPYSIIGNTELVSIAKKKALYRIICEGLGNAVRHGGAKNVEVVLKISAHDINLEITDDGIGFDSENSTIRGLGLRNLYQLVEGLHGEIKIESKLNQGTKVKIIIPNIKRMEKGSCKTAYN